MKGKNKKMEKTTTEQLIEIIQESMLLEVSELVYVLYSLITLPLRDKRK